MCLSPPGSSVITDKMLKSGQVISAAYIHPRMLIWHILFQHKVLSTKRSDLSLHLRMWKQTDSVLIPPWTATGDSAILRKCTNIKWCKKKPKSMKTYFLCLCGGEFLILKCFLKVAFTFSNCLHVDWFSWIPCSCTTNSQPGPCPVRTVPVITCLFISLFSFYSFDSQIITFFYSRSNDKTLKPWPGDTKIHDVVLGPALCLRSDSSDMTQMIELYHIL